MSLDATQRRQKPWSCHRNSAELDSTSYDVTHSCSWQHGLGVRLSGYVIDDLVECCKCLNCTRTASCSIPVRFYYVARELSVRTLAPLTSLAFTLLVRPLRHEAALVVCCSGPAPWTYLRSPLAIEQSLASITLYLSRFIASAPESMERQVPHLSSNIDITS